ncbi:Disease resistance protein [Quillaja saponaria]|uniref:Disease resistance protein n=1 Tax=Quillaja saponaria TaxID=32244 RepID=A0AAD7LS08_QUISA|nr:Disease resistance protein [Quillaja saponaria]
MATIPFIVSVFFYVLVTSSVLDILLLAITKVLFYCLEEEIKWIDKESEILNALWRDVDGVNPEAKVAGLTLQLNEVEQKWLKSTSDLFQDATNCVGRYKNLREGRYVVILHKIKPIINLVREMKRIKTAIQSHLEGKKKDSIDIFKRLERSRSKIGSLKERRGHIDGYPPVRKSEVITSLTRKAEILSTRENLICGMDSEIQSVKLLIIVQAFLKDLHMLQLESETEKVWVKQAKEIIREAESAIENFTGGRPNQVRWLSTFCNWSARHKFKMEMKHIQTKLIKLLDRKDRYDFKFIYTDASKFLLGRLPLTLQDTNINLKDISIAVSRLSTRLSNVPLTRKKVIDEIKPLCDQLKRINELLNDAADELLFYSRKLWLQQVSNIVQIAAGSIELEAYMREARPKHLMVIKPMQRTIFLLERILTVCQIEQKESRSVVCLEEDVQEVVLQLTRGSETRLVSIMGMQGIGKTTLAKEVYNHRTILQRFPIRAWVNIDAVRKRFQLIKNGVPNQIRNFWIDKLRNHLASGDHLLVLDKISSTSDWDMLREVLDKSLSSSRRSRILLTTRYYSKFIHAGNNLVYGCHYVQLQTEEQSWKLYEQMLTLRSKRVDKSKEKLIKKDVGRCGGLPCSIVSLADQNPEAAERWCQSAWLENLDQNFTVSTPVNRSSPQSRILNEENSFLLRYLSYSRLFPGNFEITARRLVALWVAEGLVYVDNPNRIINKYVVGDNHLNRLIKRNMIQVVKRKLDGKVKTCRLPGVVGELIMRYKDIHPQYNIDLNVPTLNRLVDNYDNNDESFEHIHGVDTNSPEVWREYRRLVSFISTDTREGNKPGEDIHSFHKRGIANKCFGELKVLDLERVFRPQLPKSIGKLIGLTYLSLRWTYIEEIPSSIGNLCNLETLDLKHTHVRNLPITVWKMKCLQHLYLEKIYRIVFLYEPNTTGSLNNLQTLWGAFLDESSPFLKKKHFLAIRYQLNSLTKLGLTFQLEQVKQKDLAKWLANLQKLQYLRLTSINHGGKPQALRLEPLSRLQNLYSLHLCGDMENISFFFPKSLTDLTLSATSLKNDPMQDLQSLQKLRSLCLYSDSFMGESIVCSVSGFPQLKFLKIANLKALKEWDIQEDAMPSLWELEIRSCHLLEVPSGLKHLKRLHELKLSDMPGKFTTTIRENTHLIWRSLHNPPVVTILF